MPNRKISLERLQRQAERLARVEMAEAQRAFLMNDATGWYEQLPLDQQTRAQLDASYRYLQYQLHADYLSYGQTPVSGPSDLDKSSTKAIKGTMAENRAAVARLLPTPPFTDKLRAIMLGAGWRPPGPGEQHRMYIPGVGMPYPYPTAPDGGTVPDAGTFLNLHE